MNQSLSFPATSEEPQTVSQRVVKVLLISPFDEDHRHLREILAHSKWQLHSVRTQAEALAFLLDNPTPVALCESELPDGTWRDMLSQLARVRFPPMLVVTSRLADELLWSEVLNLGGYNVLAKPLDMKEVFHVVSLAWLLWKRQWEQPQQYAQTA